MATIGNNAERKGEMSASTHHESIPNASFIVQQPPKLESLLGLLADLEKISEIVGEESSRDLGGGIRVGGGAMGGSSGGTSLRDQAIQALPSTEIMRQMLRKHLQHEVRDLEKRAARMARSTKKGSAYLLNELYAKIRRIQSLMAELIEAAADLVKRLYIRLFIDHQQLV